MGFFGAALLKLLLKTFACNDKVKIGRISLTAFYGSNLTEMGLSLHFASINSNHENSCPTCENK